MGLDLLYRSEGASFCHRFSDADWRTIEALRSHLRTEVELCFDIEEYGEEVWVKRDALKSAAATMERFLTENARLLPATYQFKLERFPVPGVPAGGFEAGGVSGLRLPGDSEHSYAIDAGLNRCELTKYAVGPDGRGVVVEKRDMRRERELLTESAGKVEFRRRAAKTTLRRALREIVAFAESSPNEEVAKVVG